MPDGLRLALTTLTVAPVRGPRETDRRTAGIAMALAPLVGLLLGLLAAGVLTAATRLAGSPLLGAALAVAALALLTRGLHLDGLADTVDGLASYAPPEQARAVMRSPEVGPLGVAAVVLVLLVQVAALTAATEAGHGAAALVLAAVTGRLAVTAACTRTTPAATPEGLGAAVAGTVPPGVPVLWTAVVLAAAAAVAAGSAEVAEPAEAARPVAAVAIGLGTAWLLRRHLVRRIGGLTGDVLGFLVEATTTVVLVAVSFGGSLGGD